MSEEKIDWTSAWTGATYTSSNDIEAKSLTLADLCRIADELRKIPPAPIALRLGYSMRTRCYTNLPAAKNVSPLPMFSGLPIKLDYKLEPWQCEPEYTPEGEERMMEFLAAALLTGELP